MFHQNAFSQFESSLFSNFNLNSAIVHKRSVAGKSLYSAGITLWKIGLGNRVLNIAVDFLFSDNWTGMYAYIVEIKK